MLRSDDAIDELVRSKARYPRDAYEFVREALDFTMRKHKKGAQQQKDRHISGQELLEGAREYALNQFGPMTWTLLESWNLKRCEDIGEIVYHMVEVQILRTRKGDSLDDFKNGYDFETAFRQPFEPRSIISVDRNANRAVPRQSA
jgi:uncharacterized repeat protein (TIGR04138 family)